MRLNFKNDNAFFFGMLLLFGSSPIAYLLGGVFKWLGLIFGFGLILFLMLRNKSIKTVFILNDRSDVDYMNKWSFSNNVFKFIVDPFPASMRDLKVSNKKKAIN